MPHDAPLPDLGALDTEAVRPELAELDVLAVPDLVALMTIESTRASDAVVAATAQISEAVAAIARRLAEGGRLIYVGAGTAGRLGVLDEAEAGPTFDAPDGLIVAVFAGGREAVVRPAEGAEDDADGAVAELRALHCSPRDCVVGISASGQTPFVLGAMGFARAAGALTVGIVSNRASAIAAAAELPIELLVGGEVIAGSTRLNAGTAQKITLNIVSTAVMIQLGKTYGNLMVDVRPTNEKLRDRATRIVAAVAKVSPDRAREALEACGWRTKPACIVAASSLSAEEAAELLEASGGRLRAASPALEADRTAARALEAAHVGRAATAGRAGSRSGNQRRLGVAAFLYHGRLVPGDVAVGDGRVVALGLEPASRGIAVPGLVDLQVNGYGGLDVLGSSVEDLATLGKALARDGVLAYQPTLISSEAGRTRAAEERIAELTGREPDGARILGIHLEGPFLSPLRAGTHPPERLAQPDLALLMSLLNAGPVTMVTLAPELPGALELVAECRRQGVVVSFGHSDADAEQARRGFEAGGQAVTHVFNAMSPVSARARLGSGRSRGPAGDRPGNRRRGPRLGRGSPTGARRRPEPLESRQRRHGRLGCGRRGTCRGGGERSRAGWSGQAAGRNDRRLGRDAARRRPPRRRSRRAPRRGSRRRVRASGPPARARRRRANRPRRPRGCGRAHRRPRGPRGAARRPIDDLSRH